MLGQVFGLLLTITVGVQGSGLCNTGAVDILLNSVEFPTLEDLQAKCSDAVREMDCKKRLLDFDMALGVEVDEGYMEFVNGWHHYTKELCTEGSAIRQAYLEGVDCYIMVDKDEAFEKQMNESSELVEDFGKSKFASELRTQMDIEHIKTWYLHGYWMKSFSDAVNEKCPEVSQGLEDLLTYVYEPILEWAFPKDHMTLWVMKFTEYKAIHHIA